MAAWSQLETEALYLGLEEFGNDFDAIKAKYQDELNHRSVRACLRKVKRDDRRHAKRIVLLQELLQEQIVHHMACNDHVAVHQIQVVLQGLAEGFAQVVVPNQEEVVLVELNSRIQSLTNRLEEIKTSVMDKFTEFKPHVMEIEEGPLEDGNIDEEEQANAQYNAAYVLIDQLKDGCNEFEAAVVFKIDILLAAFRRRFC